MPQQTYFTCCKCKNATHNTEFALNSANYKNLNANFGGGGPMGGPGGNGAAPLVNFNDSVCVDCQDALAAQLNAILDPLKA